MTGRRISWLIVAALAVWPLAAIAADLPAEPKPTPAPAVPPVLAAPDATCLEWTDGCRTCQRPAAGEAACSNIGIACQPQALRCVRR